MCKNKAVLIEESTIIQYMNTIKEYCFIYHSRIKCGIAFRICISEENHCHPNPCRNAGVCTEADGAFVCTCSEGFKGVNCEGRNNEWTFEDEMLSNMLSMFVVLL